MRNGDVDLGGVIVLVDGVKVAGDVERGDLGLGPFLSGVWKILRASVSRAFTGMVLFARPCASALTLAMKALFR